MTCKKGLVDHQRTRIFILVGETWERISDITDIKPPKASYAEDDVTTLEDRDKTVVTAGAREHSNVEVTMLEVSGSEMQQRLYMANYNGSCERFKIVKPDKYRTTYEFSGYVKEFGDETDPAKKTRIGMSLTVSGKVGKYNAKGAITPDFERKGNTTPPKVSSITITPDNITNTDPADVSIVFDKKVEYFNLGSLTAEHGKLSNLTTTDGGINWTAKFTPNAGVSSQQGFINVLDYSYATVDGLMGLGNKSSQYTVNNA